MSRKRARGVSMITAIFLILVIAVLGAYIASVATTQHTAETLDLQGAKAYQAAYAGIQWGVYQALRNGSCPVASTSFALTGALGAFAVTVLCTNTTPGGYSENGVTKNIYRITSTGCSPPSGTSCPGVQGGYYVERQLEVTLDN
ncbi:MAG: agglutinin biogenesis protein MshP [Betaproteobacteria bacterium]|nr:agglutinin biogenesis protein MshP [Betaproteobacteria bacterium]